jgi:hypothetical protein
MNDFDLKSKIKAVRAPERGAEYWEAFPDRVLAELRAAPVHAPAPQSDLSGLWWIGRLALACLALTFCLWQSGMPRALSHALRQDEMAFRQSVTRVHDNLDRLMQDEHGLHRLIEDHS